MELDPDLTTPILVPEKVSRYQVEIFKELLERITNKKEISDEEKNIFNSKIIKPLLNFFDFKKDLLNKFIVVKEKTWWDLTPREQQEYLRNEYERYERISGKKY
jgi:hypothetical protein